MRNFLISTLLALVGFMPSNAQYTFTLDVSWSGNCSGYTSQMNQLIGKYKSQAISGFPTEQSCKQARAMCQQELGHIELIYYDLKTGKIIKTQATNCKLNVVAGLCTGRPLAGNTIQIGVPNINGVSQGTSFYSTNPAEEIKNWSEDFIEQMVALFDGKLPDFKLTRVNTGDIDFDNARKNNDDDYEFTGRMPEGSVRYVPKNDQIVSVGPPTKGSGVSGLDDFLSGNFVSLDMREGGSGRIYSEDFDMSNIYSELQKREEERRQRELEWEHKEASVWDEIKSKLDDENFHLLAYILQTNNGGIRPKFLGITESGRYVFESIDGNNVFSISKDAKAIQTLTFEEHSWKDDNIIKAIQENGFKDAISDRYKFEYPSFDNIKGGKISFKDLKNLSANELRKLLPYIKGELKLKLFDNSSELSYEYMQLSDWHGSGGIRATLSSGGKDNISASLSVTGEGGDVSKNSDTFFDNKEKVFSKEHDDSELKKEYAIFGGFMKIKGTLNAEIELSSLEAKATGGYVKKVYGGFLYCSGGAEVKGGTHIDKKIVVSPWNIFYVKGKVGGFQCKNITHATDDIPTLKQ